jgi:hypothetical protein
MRGQIFVPAPHPAEFRVCSAAKEGRTHHTDDLTQQFLLAAQAALNFSDQVPREIQVMERLFHDLGRMLRLAAITCEALLCCAAATLSGFGVLLSVSFRGRHVALLASVVRLEWWQSVQAPVPQALLRL